MKPLRNISFRGKLLAALILMGVMMVLMLLFNSWYLTTKAESEHLTSTTKDLELAIANFQESFTTLIYKESKGPIFEELQAEKHLEKVHRQIEAIQDIIDYYIERGVDQGLNDLLFSLSNEISSLESNHQLLLDKILQRGFKNKGLEGEMRTDIHQIENEYTDLLSLGEIMMLRRHEKDFFIRKDITYARKLNQELDNIIDKLEDKDTKRAYEAIGLLLNYRTKFLQIQQLENEIGYTEKEGLIDHINRSLEQAVAKNKRFQELIVIQEKKQLATIEVYFFLGWLIIISLMITGSLWLSKLFTWRLRLLADYMNQFVDSDFNYKRNLSRFSSNDEIGTLFKNFKILEDQVTIHFSNYKKSVEKRTKEILAQKDMIVDQKKEIENQKFLLELRNAEIIDSIRYAEKIQKSILLREDYLNRLFKEHFILFKPKDIVSGDFYWGKRIGKKIFFAIADCTGHGVPGAFMSIIGHNLLTYAINEKKLREPSDVLNFLNEKIKTVLQQSKHGNTLKDGMDIALFCLNTETYQLKFSGAQRPLIISRGEELIELKGNRFPAGGYITLKEDRFSQKEIQLMPGDQIFAFSDGYIDQFGGSGNKKFKYRPFKNLITTISDEPKEKQKEILLESFEIWKGENPQVDDICVFSAKI